MKLPGESIMRLLFSDETTTPNFIGISTLYQAYQNDRRHRGEYLSALWNTAGEGTGRGLLRDFEMSCMAENTLAREYKAAADAVCEDDPFLQEPKLENLRFLCAAPPCLTLLEYDHRQVLTKNRPFLDRLIQRTQWDPESLRAFRLLLILLLQLKQAEDTVLLEQGEKVTLEQTLRKYQLAAAPTAARIYPVEGGALYLRNGNIYKVVFTEGKNPQHTAISPKDAVVQDFAPYGETQRLELTVGGLLTETSAADIYQVWAGSGRPKLRMTACCGGLCMLLCQDGSILSNVDEIAWKDAVWVGAGLNSVSAICGAERRLCTSIPVRELTNVREAVTYSDGTETHYGAILQDGTLVVDGEKAGAASAAALCSKGVVFVRDREILLCRFRGRGVKRICTCADEVQALCVDDCSMFQPPHLRIIWLTEKEVLQKCLNL